MADARYGLAGAVAAWLTKAGEPRKLLIREARERLRPARRDGGPARVGHRAAGSRRKPRMASIVAAGCSSISQWPELGMLNARTLAAAKRISFAKPSPKLFSPPIAKIGIASLPSARNLLLSIPSSRNAANCEKAS